MSSIKVSIIIPVYNAERYIHECLSRAQNQSLKDIEIIFVDDGSNDSSLNILKTCSLENHHIKIIEEKHHSAGYARNRGIEAAKGEYLAIWDVDDIYYFDMLEEMYNCAQKNKLDVVICKSKIFEEKTQTSRRAPFHLRTDFLPSKSVFSYDDFNHKISFFDCFKGWSWDKLFKRRFIKENNIYFQDQSSINDLVFVYSALARANRIGIVDKVLVEKRRNAEGSISRKYPCTKEWDCFYKALIGLKMNLIGYELYEKMKSDFINYALVFTKWNLQAFRKNEGFFELKVKLKNEWGKELGIIDRDRCFFYDKDSFDYVHTVLNEDVDDNKGQIKISIIVPVYNVEKYLRHCLATLITQTFYDIEIICINDGSTDNSLSILRAYEKKDKRIRVIDKPNTGYGHTMNIGLKEARGEYIGIVESDDWIEPDMYEQLYAIAKQHPDVDVVKSDIQICEKNGRQICMSLWGGIVPYEKEFKFDENKGLIQAIPGTTMGIYKRSMIKDNNIKYNETPGASFQDVSFSLQIKIFAQRGIVINKGFYHYRWDNPTSSRNTSDKGFCIFDEYQFIENIISGKSGVKEKYEPYILVSKYRRYKWCNQSVFSKERFEKKMAEEFALSRAEGYMIKELWPLDKWNDVNEIIKKHCGCNKFKNPNDLRLLSISCATRENKYFFTDSLPKCLWGRDAKECRSLLGRLKFKLGMPNIIVMEKEKEKWGTVWNGIPICSPQFIDGYYVIIYEGKKSDHIKQEMRCISVDRL